ncbi:MAG TPA: hypothetical protein VNX65_01725 [Patescibacteria group bacterium]|nr:hypothetical protein [Patescibacteria group bacterium]
MSGRKLLGISVLILQLAIVGASFWAILHKQDVIDWWRLKNYHPTSTAIQLVASTTMVGRGQNMFYVSQPEVDDKIAFNQNCPNNSEQGLVLGCYRSQRIYLYDVNDPQLAGVKEVTAAHEMLHAAYERLSSGDKQRINKMLDPIIKNITDERLLGVIKLYNSQEPGELYNEMHSVLGTEYRTLTPELEQYYSQYFKDRASIVTMAEHYEGIFSASKNRIATMDAQLASLKQQIDNNNKDLANRQILISQATQQLNQLRNSGSIEEYNHQVPVYNDQVRQFNSLITSTKALVVSYNTLVDQRNQEVAGQNNLYHSLDSRYQTVPQN